MWNFFEQPWTLLFAAVIILLIVLMVRRIFPDKRHWWQIALPVFLAAAALALDFFVRTDTEKIKAVINTSVKAVENEDPDAIESIISADYYDSFHNSKRRLMNHCRARLSEPLIKKNIATILSIEIQSAEAAVIFTVRILFDKESSVYAYKPLMFAKLKLHLQKDHSNEWLIDRAEILEIDRRPAKWTDISAARSLL